MDTSNLSSFANDHLYLTPFLSTFHQTRKTLSRTLCCSQCLPVALKLLMPASIHSTLMLKLKMFGDLHHFLIHHLSWCLRKALLYLYIFISFMFTSFVLFHSVNNRLWLLVSRIYSCTCDWRTYNHSVFVSDATSVPLSAYKAASDMLAISYIAMSLVQCMASVASTCNYYWK